MPTVYNSSSSKEKKSEKKEKPKSEVNEILKKRTSNPLASFVSRPKGVRFETQEKKEKIVLLLRRHWLTNIPWMTGAVLMVLLPGLLRLLPLFDFLPPRFQFITRLVWYLLTLAFVLEQFLTWFFNINIITDERIIDIDFPTILYRDISSAKIDQIQDISVKVGGFARSLFNYGDVVIQTAATEPQFNFEAVPRPSNVSEVLNKLIIEEEQEKLNGRAR